MYTVLCSRVTSCESNCYIEFYLSFFLQVTFQDDDAKQEAVEGMKNLATNANEMAPKDLSNIATSLSTFTTNLATQGVAVNDQDVRKFRIIFK